MTNRTICRIGDRELIEAIAGVSTRLVFAAPGVSAAVAKELSAAWRRLGGQHVSVILDVDPDVCRLGYGTLEGLQDLQKTANELGTLVCRQPGLRIGIVVGDSTTLVYTPTPLLIASPEGPQGHPNGLVLSSPPEKLAAELGIGPGAHADQQIGLDKVPEQKVQQLAADLKANPPLPFDISRPVLVFNSQVEFVEFNLEKIQLHRQEVPIPQKLTGLADTNIHSLFRLDVDRSLLAEKEKLERQKREIERQFCHPMRGFGGSIIRRALKADFEKAAEKLRAELDSFRQVVRQQLSAIAENNKARLIELLLPAVKNKLPPQCRHLAGHPDADPRLRQYLANELHDSFAKVAKVADEMRLTYRYKGVTLECLRDSEFIHLAKEAFPDLQLHEEYSAAREKAPT